MNFAGLMLSGHVDSQIFATSRLMTLHLIKEKSFYAKYQSGIT
jgi:hypothetical protein